MAYNDVVTRSGTSQVAREIPETVANEILADTYEGSAVLRLGQIKRMPARQHRIPVLKTFADAFWIDGVSQAAKDIKRKQTTNLTWDNVYLTADELAVLVVVPDAWLDDSTIGWGEIRKEVSRAFAKKIDQAVFFGDGTPPAGFSGPVGGLVGGAVSAGNFVTLGTTLSGSYNDVGLDLAAVAEDLAKDGYDTTGWAARKGFRWRLTKVRDTTGQPVYNSTLNGPDGPNSTSALYNEPYYEVGNGAWDDTEAFAIAGEWDNLVVGVRQDMSFQVFDSGVISDDSGVVVYNAMQQDGKILRAVMRVGYAVPTPVKALGGTFPFGILRPVGAS
jgi:HK97 family phage major capsid protein